MHGRIRPTRVNIWRMFAGPEPGRPVLECLAVYDPSPLAAPSLEVLIEKILTHLGLQARAPPRAPARRSQLQAA